MVYYGGHPYSFKQNSIDSTILFVERVKIKLGNSMFPRLKISETNKFFKF